MDINMQKGRMLVIGRVRPPFRDLEDPNAGGASVRPLGDGGSVLKLSYTSRSSRIPRGMTSAAPDLQLVEFPFPKVFGIESTQEEVFSSVRGTLEGALTNGQNAVVFAYGQTGSGKTYTMLGGGTFKTRGLMQRVLGMVFAHVDKCRETGGTLGVSMSMVEVYCEAAYDILRHLPPGTAEIAASQDPDNVGARLAALTASAGGKVGPLEQWPRVELLEGEGGTLQCRGLKTWEVGSEAAALGLLLAGHLARTSSSTPLNAASSRSHAVLSLTVSGVGYKTSKIHLVDLAGSERVHKTTELENPQSAASRSAAGLREREGAQINLSLHCLELVMLALAEKQRAAGGGQGAMGSRSSSRRGSRTSTSAQVRASSVPVRRRSASSNSSFSSGKTGGESLDGMLLSGGEGGTRERSGRPDSASGGRAPPSSSVHIPYRNSVLTSLLRDALGSYCWPILVACVAPEPEHGEESSSTCRFAARCALMDALTVPSETSQPGSRGVSNELSKALARAQERIRELEALSTLHARHAEELTQRVAELEVSASSILTQVPAEINLAPGVEAHLLNKLVPSPSTPPASMSGALQSTAPLLPKGLSLVEDAVYSFLQQQPTLSGFEDSVRRGSRRSMAISVPLLSKTVPDLENMLDSSLPPPLQDWDSTQIRYAFLLLREAVAAAVSVAGASAAEADSQRSRAESAELDAAKLRESILSLKVLASHH